MDGRVASAQQHQQGRRSSRCVAPGFDAGRMVAEVRRLVTRAARRGQVVLLRYTELAADSSAALVLPSLRVR